MVTLISLILSLESCNETDSISIHNLPRLRMSMDLRKKENGFTLKKTKSKKYPAGTITNADYEDNLALLTKTLA